MERSWKKCYKDCPVEEQDDCGSKSQCKFPFTYENISYNHCISNDNAVAPWCITTPQWNEKGNWKFCSDKCPMSSNSTSDLIIPAVASGLLFVLMLIPLIYVLWRKKKRIYHNDVRQRYPGLQKQNRETPTDAFAGSESNIANSLRCSLHGENCAKQTTQQQNYDDDGYMAMNGTPPENVKRNEGTVSPRDLGMTSISDNENETNILRNYENETIQMRQEKIMKSLSGDPSKLNRRLTLNEQIAFLSYNRDFELDRSCFIIEQVLGSGNFGTILLGKIFHNDDSQITTPVAIKTLTNSMDDEQLYSLIYEMKILSNLKSHLNIVNLMGCCTSDYAKNGNLWLLLEYCEKGDMKSFLIDHRQEFRLNMGKGTTKNPDKPRYITMQNCNTDYVSEGTDIHETRKQFTLDTRVLLIWSYDIAKGMEYLSGERIMHGDLATRNILIKAMNNRLIPKVADFGLSKRFYDDTSYLKKKRPHTPFKWMALEYLLDGCFRLTSDVWSYGVVLWEIFSLGQEPYPGKEYGEVLGELRNGYTLQYPDDVAHNTSDWKPKEFYETISSLCFKFDPTQRDSFAKLVGHIEKHMTREELSKYGNISDEN